MSKWKRIIDSKNPGFDSKKPTSYYKYGEWRQAFSGIEGNWRSFVTIIKQRYTLKHERSGQRQKQWSCPESSTRCPKRHRRARHVLPELSDEIACIAVADHRSYGFHAMSRFRKQRDCLIHPELPKIVVKTLACALFKGPPQMILRSAYSCGELAERQPRPNILFPKCFEHLFHQSVFG